MGLTKSAGPAVVNRYIVSIDTAGTAGSAAGSGFTPPVEGFLVGIYFDFHASAAATTDTTVTEVSTGRTLLTLTDTKTDAMKITQLAVSDTTGTAITGVYAYMPVHGEIKIALAQCDALTAALVAHVYILEA